MSYTPVPAVAAGDWIDEVFINTYWVDNFAAGIPDQFSAKGQLAVGLGVDSMGILNAGTNGYALVADDAQTLGLKWDVRAKITFFSSFPSVSGLTTTVGDQTITASSAISGVPSTAIAIFLTASSLWTNVASFPMTIFCRTVGNNGIVVTGLVANTSMYASGVVPLNSGQFVKRILTTAPSSVGAFCSGYVE
jgi:hypothetical protein